MAMSFVFDPDADFQILECTLANLANPANPVDGRQARLAALAGLAATHPQNFAAIAEGDHLGGGFAARPAPW
jgi:hypothetical protein